MSENLLNVASVSSDLFDQERLDLMRSTSYSGLLSGVGVSPITAKGLREKYAEISREELLDLLANTELRCTHLEDENYAFTQQVGQSQKDILEIQSEFTKCKTVHAEKVAELSKSRDKWRSLAEARESEIIFLEDHARFSAEQTRLSISHWDLLLKNRDENIELLSARVVQLTNESRVTNEGISADKYTCLLERYKSLRDKWGEIKKELPGEDEFSSTSNDRVHCPWRHQADVRVSQLERVTSQLNATYEQLHAKSDELLLQNRTVGVLRRRVLELEAKTKKYRMRLHNPSPVLTSPTPSGESTD